MGHGRSNWMLIDAVAYQISGAEPMGRPSRSYARATAVQTPWQSSRVAMTPPFKKCRGPAACSGCGCQVATDASPCRRLLSRRPSGLSAPHPQLHQAFHVGRLQVVEGVAAVHHTEPGGPTVPGGEPAEIPEVEGALQLDEAVVVGGHGRTVRR